MFSVIFIILCLARKHTHIMPNLKRRYKKRRKSIARKIKRRRTRRPRKNARTGGLTGKELKFKDFEVESKIINLDDDAMNKMADPTTISCLSWTDQGTGASQRLGRQILIKSIHIDGVIFQDATTTTSGVGATICTWWLVIDKQTNSAVPLSENIIITASTAIHAFRNLEYSDRFTILARGTSKIGPPSNAYNGVNQTATKQINRFNVYKRLNLPVTFKNSTTGIVDVVDNSLHFVIAGEKGGVAAVPKLTYNARMRYYG